MPAQDFGAKPALEAHDILGPYRLPDRYHWQHSLPKIGQSAAGPASVGPGAITLTRMPCAARSTAITCVSERAPPFEAT
jgi:hypothetical protein